MDNKITLSCLLAVAVGISPVFLFPAKRLKKPSIDAIIKGKKVARYWVQTDYIQKKSVHLIDLIEDIIEFNPKANGWSLPSKRHEYYITCMAQTQTNMQDEQFIKLLVHKSLFIIPAVGTVIGTIGGVTYRLESVERVKATLKNPEQIELVLSVKH